MKRLIPAFGVPLILAAGLGQGDTRLPTAPPAAPDPGHRSSLALFPWTLGQAQSPRFPAPAPRVLPRLNPALPFVQPPRAPGDAIPHTYMVYGLRTGPSGMVVTDRNGAVIPVPFNPQIVMKPFNGLPAVPAPALPRAFTLPRITPLPAPKR